MQRRYQRRHRDIEHRHCQAVSNGGEQSDRQSEPAEVLLARPRSGTRRRKGIAVIVNSNMLPHGAAALQVPG